MDDLGTTLDEEIPNEVLQSFGRSFLTDYAPDAMGRLLDKLIAPTDEEMSKRAAAMRERGQDDPDLREVQQAMLEEAYSQHGLPVPSIDSFRKIVDPAPVQSPSQTSPLQSGQRRGRHGHAIAVESVLASVPAAPPAGETPKEVPDRKELREQIEQAFRAEPLTDEEWSDLNALVRREERILQEMQRQGIPVEVNRQEIKASLRRRLEEDYYIGADDRIHYRRASWRRWVRLGLAILAGTWTAITAWLLFWR
jgi:hypothetical protein